MKIILAATIAVITLSQAAQSSVLITNGAVGIIKNSAGLSVSAGSIGLLVADTDGNFLVDPFGTTLSEGMTFGNFGTDLILGVYQAIDLGTNQYGFDLGGTDFSYSGSFAAGDPLYLVWFPSISTVGSTVGTGVSYGTFRTTDINLGPGPTTGTMAWTAPTDGTEQRLFSLDSALGGNPAVAPTAFNATLTTVPEPSAYGLVGVAALLSIFLRKRQELA